MTGPSKDDFLHDVLWPEPFADLSLALASYRPGGGVYLYDEEQIVVQMRHAMQQLAAEIQARTNR